MENVNKINGVFLWTVVTALVGSYLYQFLGLSNCDYFVSLLYSQFILILPTIVYIIRNKLSVKELLRIKKIRFGSVFLLILFAYLILPLMQVINMVSMLFSENVTASKMQAIVSGKPFLFSIVLIAVIPAMLEESVYRGSFYNTYSKHSPRKALLFSGLLFGLMHLNFNQFSYAFVMGVIFCLLIEATDSIVSSMIVHFVINGTSVAMLYSTPYLTKLTDNQSAASVLAQDVNDVSNQMLLLSILMYGILALITTGLAILVYIAIARYQGRWEEVKSIFTVKREQKENVILSQPLLFGMAICFLYMILSELA